MKIINAYKIEMKADMVSIYCQRINAGLLAGLGTEPMQSKLTLSNMTIMELRRIMHVHPDVSTIFWLERTLRKSKGLEQIMEHIGQQGLSYKISGETLS